MEENKTGGEVAPRLPRLTRVIVVVTAVALAVWDLFAFVAAGGAATVSTAVGDWFQRWPVVLFAWFFLTGHFVMMTTDRTTGQWLVVAGCAAAGLALGGLVTWLRG